MHASTALRVRREGLAGTSHPFPNAKPSRSSTFSPRAFRGEKVAKPDEGCVAIDCHRIPQRIALQALWGNNLSLPQFEARRSLLIISVLAFALRLAYAAASGELRSPQVWEPEQIATNLIEHHEFAFQSKPDPLVYRAYTEPLYPFIAAAVYLVTGHSRTALVLLQLAVAAVAVWLCGWVAILPTRRGRAGLAPALL